MEQQPQATNTVMPRAEDQQPTPGGRLHVYGAGMAGLLAGHMLRRMQPVLHEQQSNLPDNHGALLRFRSEVVAQESGQSFRKVRVMKAIKHTDGRIDSTSTMQDANLYSYKVSRQIHVRSVIDLAPCERFVAPPDFLRRMVDGLGATIVFNDPLTPARLEEHSANGDDIISTIPMPTLMRIADHSPVPPFDWSPVWSVATRLLDVPIDVYQTIYYPGAEPYYRASITGERLIIECMAEPDGSSLLGLVETVLGDFGIDPYEVSFVPRVRRQEYGKLTDSANYRDVRQQFVVAMTDRHRLYSVGRFATWRQILLDDVVADVRKVSRWIDQRNSYARRRDAR